MLSGVFLFLSLAGPVQAAEYNVPLATVYMNAQDAIVAKLCHDPMCTISANAAYKTCYTDDLKKHSTPDVPAADAKSIGDSLFACTAQAMRVKVASGAELNQRYLGNYKVADVKPVATPVVDPVSQIPLEKRYEARTETVLSELTALKNRIKVGDRGVCPGYSGLDMAGCAAKALTTNTIDISIAPHLALALVQLGNSLDRSKMGPAANHYMVKAMIDVAESVQKKNFFLRRTPITSDEDRIAQARLLKEDDQRVAMEYSRCITQLQYDFDNLPKRLPATAVPGVPTRASLEPRLKNLLRHPW